MKRARLSELPSLHQLRAALRVARFIDASGNDSWDVRDVYRHAMTKGEHPEPYLVDGEEILIRAGLVEQHEGRLIPLPGLGVVAALDDRTALELIGNQLPERDADEAADDVVSEVDRSRIGAIGEELVLELCRNELVSLGRSELAARVVRVSLVSDALGYDVLAPVLVGRTRRLEVKTGTRPAGTSFRFFLSRNEFEIGRRYVDSWALVACRLRPDGDDADVLGWCRVDALRPYLPDDHNGRWTEALVRLPLASLIHGLPPAL